MRRLPAGFWLDLNIFLAGFAILASFGLSIFFIPSQLLAKLAMPARQAENAGYIAAHVLMLAFLLWWWRRHGLSPARIQDGRAWRFRVGHAVVALSNASLLAFWLPRLIPGAASTQSFPLLLAAFAAAAPLAAMLGVLIVRSSAQRGDEAAAFADTVALPGARAKPASAAKKGDGGSAAGVVFGLLVIAFIAFVAIVFGALSFQYRMNFYTYVVVPAIIVGYIVYAGIAIGLHNSGRRSAALTFTWSPLIFLFAGLPLLQLAMLLLEPLFKR